MNTKTTILTILLALIGLSSTFAQVGIGTQTPAPSSILDLTATNKGFLPPRLTTAERDLITSPATGLTIYNTTNKCIEFWNATNWISACDGSIVTTPKVDALTCGSATFSPSVYQKDVAYTGTLTIPYTGGNGANYPQYMVTSTGNTNFTATLPAGTLTNGAGNLVFNVTGNSSVHTPAVFAISFGGQSCNARLANCGAFVAAGVFKEFQCYNLGAYATSDPNIPERGTNGSYYQWGRSLPAATVTATTDAIVGTWGTQGGTSADGNWTSTAGGGPGNPCPAGYRVPSNAEWNGVRNAALNTVSRTLPFTQSATNFGSAIHYGPSESVKTLTLPAAGYRLNTGGTLSSRGNFASYWSSTENGTSFAFFLNFDINNAATNAQFRTFGYSVRCISE